MNTHYLFRLLPGLVLAWLLSVPTARAYSVLSHEASIDSCWQPCLRPALERRFPGGTDEQLREAKAYAYGGSIIQDMGYYPLGAALFTNLTHYVRSGDFVRNLLAQAHDRNEYAFALGALAHYTADIYGHEVGINKAVPLLFPDLKVKYGPVVTYEQNPVAHGRTEFAFDVVQLAAGRYRSEAYHDLFGFKVAKELLERAFERTYGLPLNKIFVNVDLALGSYRFAVRNIIPLASRAAWRANRHELRRVNRRVRRRDYVFKESQSRYKKEYGNPGDRPGFGARIVAGVIRVLPKVGKLRSLKLITPTPEAQAVFRQSFRQTIANYCRFMEEQTSETAQAIDLPNTDIDTGHPSKLGEYPLADRTYGEWVRDLAENHFKEATPAIQEDILTFFANPGKLPLDSEEKEKNNIRKTEAALTQLRALKLGQ